MLAVFITRAGSPEVVQTRETTKPVLKKNQALVRVRAAGLNYAEIVARKGFYPDAPKFPFIAGYEFAGVVEDIESGDAFVPGDRVVGVSLFGGQAQFVAIDQKQLFKIPDSMSFEQAAAMPVNYLTAYYALYKMANLRRNEKVLIHSCAGGVGTAAVQLALTDDAEIFGTTSRDEKVEYLRKIGVRHPINYRSENFVDVVKARIDNGGIDIALDPIGGSTFRKSYKLLAPGGRIICYGATDLVSGNRLNLPRLIWKFLTIPAVRNINLIQNNRGIFGLALNRFIADADEVGEVMTKLLQLFENGSIKPIIGKTFDFREASEAHRYLESGESTGKIVLQFAN